MIFAVITGNKGEWQDWMHENRWPDNTEFSPTSVTVISHPETTRFLWIEGERQIRGMEFSGIIKVGTWWEKWHNTSDYQNLAMRVR